MGEAEFKFLPSQVLHVGVNGKLRLIAACRHPDVSVLRMVLKASFNANQLYK